MLVLTLTMVSRFPPFCVRLPLCCMLIAQSHGITLLWEVSLVSLLSAAAMHHSHQLCLMPPLLVMALPCLCLLLLVQLHLLLAWFCQSMTRWQPLQNLQSQLNPQPLLTVRMSPIMKLTAPSTGLHLPPNPTSCSQRPPWHVSHWTLGPHIGKLLSTCSYFL